MAAGPEDSKLGVSQTIMVFEELEAFIFVLGQHSASLLLFCTQGLLLVGLRGEYMGWLGLNLGQSHALQVTYSLNYCSGLKVFEALEFNCFPGVSLLESRHCAFALVPFLPIWNLQNRLRVFPNSIHPIPQTSRDRFGEAAGKSGVGVGSGVSSCVPPETAGGNAQPTLSLYDL